MKVITKNFKILLFIFISAFFYCLIPVMAKTLVGENISLISQIVLRSIFAIVTAVIYIFIIKKIRIERKYFPFLILAIFFCYTLTNLFFTYGLYFTEVSSTFFLFFYFILTIPVLSYLLFEQGLNLKKICVLILNLVAVYLLFGLNFFPVLRFIAFFTLLLIFGWSLFLSLKKVLSKYSVGFMIANTFAGTIILGILAFNFTSPFYTMEEKLWPLTNTSLTIILFGLANFIGWHFMIKSFKMFETTDQILLLLSQLILTLLLIIFFNGVPFFITIISSLTIIISSITIIFYRYKKATLPSRIA